MIECKSPAELARMRTAGRLVGETLQLLARVAEPGISTAELDGYAREHIAARGAEASFLGYRGFPASICASVNDEVVHGIPGPRQLVAGDLLKVDVGVLWQGYHADGAVTVPVGTVSSEGLRLIDVTRRALAAGIAAVRPGAMVSDVSAAVEQVVTAAGLSVVTEYTGHGIGRALHEEPKVPNFVSPWFRQRDVALKKGMTLAIEPMVNQGTPRTKVLDNGWTVVTRDGRLSGHFEHTVAVDDTGPVILTLP